MKILVWRCVAKKKKGNENENYNNSVVFSGSGLGLDINEIGIALHGWGVHPSGRERVFAVLYIQGFRYDNIKL